MSPGEERWPTVWPPVPSAAGYGPYSVRLSFIVDIIDIVPLTLVILPP
jgi:hypothetical protein